MFELTGSTAPRFDQFVKYHFTSWRIAVCTLTNF
jgi:hypothetical protein